MHLYVPYDFGESDGEEPDEPEVAKLSDAEIEARYRQLVAQLLAQGDQKLYNKALVDFARAVLEKLPFEDGGFEFSASFGQPSFLGHALMTSADVQEKVEFSADAMEFAAHLWDHGFGEFNSPETACEMLELWLDGCEPAPQEVTHCATFSLADKY